MKGELVLLIEGFIFIQSVHMNMALHDVGADIEPLGNFFVAEAFCRQFNHSAFPLGHPHRLNQADLPLRPLFL